MELIGYEKNERTYRQRTGGRRRDKQEVTHLKQVHSCSRLQRQQQRKRNSQRHTSLPVRQKQKVFTDEPVRTDMQSVHLKDVHINKFKHVCF